MRLAEVRCRLYTLHADNGDPLLLFGEDEAGNVFLWPTEHVRKHRFAFMRWCRASVSRWRGKRIQLQHPMCERTRRWAQSLGVTIQDGEAIV